MVKESNCFFLFKKKKN